MRNVAMGRQIDCVMMLVACRDGGSMKLGVMPAGGGVVEILARRYHGVSGVVMAGRRYPGGSGWGYSSPPMEETVAMISTVNGCSGGLRRCGCRIEETVLYEVVYVTTVWNHLHEPALFAGC